MGEVDGTPLTAGQALTRLSLQLDSLGVKNAEYERRFVEKKHAYVVAHAKAYLLAEGSIKDREAKATVDTAAERIAAETAEAELRIVRADVRILQSRIEVGRSAVGVLRAEVDLERAR